MLLLCGTPSLTSFQVLERLLAVSPDDRPTATEALKALEDLP